MSTQTADTTAVEPRTSGPAPSVAADAEVRARADRLVAALEAAGDQVDDALVEEVGAEVRRLRERVELGGDRTVVALVGGTGSGKSSLFNAISGLEFADVGALRPTTEVAAACVWGGEADALLDFLDVAPVRRIRRESVLDADREQALAGMVLLDLPDHDSVATGHALEVDRLVPLVDLLVWVVDPQKYADHLLHDRYLRHLARRAENIVVLLNQVDTVPPSAVETLRADVARMLADDGLTDVPVLATSALEHTGIAEVREVLTAAVGRPSAAVRTAVAELDALAERLQPLVGPARGGAVPELGRGTTAELARAAGVPAVAEAARSGVGTAGALARPEPPAEATVAALHDSWLRTATDGLPARWAEAIRAAVAPPGELRERVGSAVAGVDLPDGRSPASRRWFLLAVLLAVGVVGLAVAAVVVGEARVVLAVLAVLVAVGAGLAARRGTAVRRSDADAGARKYEERATAAVAEVVTETLERPTAEVLGRHDELRAALSG